MGLWQLFSVGISWMFLLYFIILKTGFILHITVSAISDYYCCYYYTFVLCLTSFILLQNDVFVC